MGQTRYHQFPTLNCVTYPISTHSPLRENGFRLSNENRRKIRRGRINNQVQPAHDVTHETSEPIVGRAQGVYRIQSVDQLKPDINPVLDLVYVGRLADSTSEQQIHEHLTEIGVHIRLWLMF